MNKSQLPGRVLTQPHVYPANPKAPSVSEGDLAAGLRGSEESDLESLAQERQYQLQLQRRLRDNEELAGLSAEELESDSLEDSLEETSVEEQGGDECDTGGHAAGMHTGGGKERDHQSVDKYFNLRYNPNWKNMKGIAEFSAVQKAHQVPSRGSVDLSQDSFYLLSKDCPKEKTQQMAKLQDPSPDFDTEALNFHEPNAMVSRKPFRLHVKGKDSEKDWHFKESPSTFSSAFALRIQDQPERVKKNFVAKNKRTLGLSTRMGNSYLQIHYKKQGKGLQEQIEDTQTVDEKPVQNALLFQNMGMDPEDKWYLKSQQLKCTPGIWETKFLENSSVHLEKTEFYRPAYSPTHSSPAALCPASQLATTVEQHQGSTHLTDAPLPDRLWFHLLPPIMPQPGSGSELNTERGQASQVKISRSNSEGFLVHMEKQKQPKVHKKLYRSKGYYSDLNVRLGGLGPDYEAVKEKKEKLRQQKEYAKQIKEHNMKNMTSVQRLPAKPKVTTSVSRQKALEYAKKIPRPKTFVARQPEEEVKDKQVLPQILRRNHLPQIVSLETLQDRHEKEKQIVAAFRTLHIL